jgi:stage III sporulation protein AE
VEQSAPEQLEELIGDVSVSDVLSPEGLLKKLWSSITGKLTESLREALGSALTLILIVFLCSLAAALGAEGCAEFVQLGGAIAISTAAVCNMSSFIGLGTEILASLSDFSKILLPSLAASASAAGAVTSATAKYAAASMFIDVLLSVAQSAIMPLIYAYIALVIAGAALGNGTLSGAAALVKWLCVSAMTALVIAFGAYLGITGVVSGSADAVSLRVAKTTISTVLPVVGSIASDAASAVVAGCGMLRNAVGIFGMLCVVCVCAVPFVRLGAQYLLYKAAAGVSAAFSEGRLAGLISALGAAFGMVLALVGAGAIMMFISLISFMKAVTGT